MAPHSSTLAWKIPWTEEPGRLHSMRLLRVGHDWATSLSCIGEGNGNPLQCSCLENPRDGGAWWAAVCGITQSWTRLKWLSSSSSSNTSLLLSSKTLSIRMAELRVDFPTTTECWRENKVLWTYGILFAISCSYSTGASSDIYYKPTYFTVQPLVQRMHFLKILLFGCTRPSLLCVAFL